MLFASSWGKKKLAVSAVNSEQNFISSCCYFREENKDIWFSGYQHPTISRARLSLSVQKKS